MQAVAFLYLRTTIMCPGGRAHVWAVIRFIVPFFSHLECICYCHSCVGAWSGCWTGCVGRGGGCDFNTVASPTVSSSGACHVEPIQPTMYLVPWHPWPTREISTCTLPVHLWLLCISFCSCTIPSHCMWVCYSGELSESIRVVAPGCIATSDVIV